MDLTFRAQSEQTFRDKLKQSVEYEILIEMVWVKEQNARVTFYRGCKYKDDSPYNPNKTALPKNEDSHNKVTAVCKGKTGMTLKEEILDNSKVDNTHNESLVENTAAHSSKIEESATVQTDFATFSKENENSEKTAGKQRK